MSLHSFFFAGFECATGLNRHGHAIDQIAATQHDRQVDADYRMLADVGIRTVREGVRWPLVDRGGGYDFASLDPFLDAARRHGMEVIWDLFHYGYPEDIDPLGEAFCGRFAAYCRAVARHICGCSSGPRWFTALNEPSFLTWAAGESALFAPHLRGRGHELKVSLTRAAIRGIDEIFAVCPQARIVSPDPVCRAVAPAGRDDLAEAVSRFNESVFEAWDILCGRSLPELGGSRRHLGVLGINYYWTNQWEIGREGQPLAADDPRRAPLRDLVGAVWRRYGGDVMITETSHVGDMRASWVEEVAAETFAMLDDGLPLQGVCLYPVLGMPEWHDPTAWARMGLWDLHEEDGRLRRVPCASMLVALQRAQRLERRRSRRSETAVVEG